MVELRYSRRSGHAQHDAQEYVDPAEVAEWEARDPIQLFHNRLIAEGSATDEELDALRAEVVESVQVAAEQALSEPLPRGVTAITDVYTDIQLPQPWTRVAQPEMGFTSAPYRTAGESIV